MISPGRMGPLAFRMGLMAHVPALYQRCSPQPAAPSRADGGFGDPLAGDSNRAAAHRADLVLGVGPCSGRRGTFRSVRDLNVKIRTPINRWNQCKHPFIWAKTPDEILTKLNREQTSSVSH